MYSIGAGFPSQFHAPTVPQVSSGSHLRSQDVALILRQQPKEALVTSEGKEKARKPVDPPPIIQLTVKPNADPAQHFLQSPYLFMCTSLYKVDKAEAWDGNAQKSLAGSLVSSLHRLKDVDNKDGGFFVFGDISVKVQGTFRLHFSLFDLRKDTSEVLYLGGITSEPFKVLLPKDFKGMDESTYLSRAFSDQGVRLRLRKEPRAMMGNKRPYPYGVEAPGSNAPIRPNIHEYGYSGDDASPNKRFRPDTEEMRKSEYPDHTGATYSTSYSQSHYAMRQPSLTGLANMSQFSGFGSLGTGSQSPYQIRSTVGNSTSYLTDPLLSSSASTSMSPSMHTSMTTPRYSDLQQPSYSNLFGYPSRSTSNNPLAFSEDSTGLGNYRTVATVGLGDEHRPATAAGIPPSLSMTQQNAQSHNASHQTHDSVGSSRGASFSHSPDMVRSAGFSDRFQLGSLPTPGRQTGRYDDQSQLNSGLYSNQRNALPVLPTESSLTSHTDTGTIHPSLQYNPDLSQSTEEHDPASR